MIKLYKRDFLKIAVQHVVFSFKLFDKIVKKERSENN